MDDEHVLQERPARMVRMDVPCRNRLDAEVLGEIAQVSTPPRISPLERPLQLDEETLATECARKARRSVRVEQTETATRASREADETLVQLRDQLLRYGGRQRLAILSSGAACPCVRGGEQAAEVRVATPRLHEQRDMGATVVSHSGAGKAGTSALGRLRRAYGECYLRTGDRPHAERLRRVCELERAVDAVVVGERERLVPELRRAGRELLRLRRAVEKAVRGMRVELHVPGHH